MSQNFEEKIKYYFLSKILNERNDCALKIQHSWKCKLYYNIKILLLYIFNLNNQGKNLKLQKKF